MVDPYSVSSRSVGSVGTQVGQCGRGGVGRGVRIWRRSPGRVLGFVSVGTDVGGGGVVWLRGAAPSAAVYRRGGRTTLGVAAAGAEAGPGPPSRTVKTGGRTGGGGDRPAGMK